MRLAKKFCITTINLKKILILAILGHFWLFDRKNLKIRPVSGPNWPFLAVLGKVSNVRLSSSLAYFKYLALHSFFLRSSFTK